MKKYKKVIPEINEKRHEWSYAKRIADEIVNDLQPYCDKIEIGGSIRRKTETVKDIEIICVPKQINKQDLFGISEEKMRAPGFINYLNKFISLIGERENGKYIKELHPSGIKIDFFIAEKDNFGIVEFQRTGPAEFSKYVLGYWMKRNGCYSDGGKLYKHGKQVPVENEIDFFKTIGLEYINPEERKLPENFNFQNIDSHGYVKRMRA